MLFSFFKNFSNVFGNSSRLSGSNKLAQKLGINVNQRITTKEADIVDQLITFCDSHETEYITQHVIRSTKHEYRIDFFLPEYEIAIEIDEHNHVGRDPVYEERSVKYMQMYAFAYISECFWL